MPSGAVSSLKFIGCASIVDGCMNGSQERACVYICTHSVIKHSLIHVASALFFCSIIYSFIHSFIDPSIHSAVVHTLHLHSFIQSFCTHVCTKQSLPSRVCVCVRTGLTRVPAVQPVVHQAGAGAPGRSCRGVHAQPQRGAPRPHLQQSAGHRQVGSQGTCSTKSSSESALCIVRCLLLCDDASLHT